MGANHFEHIYFSIHLLYSKPEFSFFLFLNKMYEMKALIFTTVLLYKVL